MLGYKTGVWRHGLGAEHKIRAQTDNSRTYDRGMRYAQRGGYTPAGQQRREQLRLEAVARFARGDKISQIAHDLPSPQGRCGGGTGPGQRAHLGAARSAAPWCECAARAAGGGRVSIADVACCPIGEFGGDPEQLHC